MGKCGQKTKQNEKQTKITLWEQLSRQKLGLQAQMNQWICLVSFINFPIFVSFRNYSCLETSVPFFTAPGELSSLQGEETKIKQRIVKDLN